MKEVTSACEAKMQTRIEALERELAKVRTGRASVSLLDGVKVDYYGAPTPLSQVATLATPDGRTITVAPYEKNTISDVEKAILKSGTGLQPNNDGNIIRIPIPALTEERRKDLVKTVKKMGEEAKVSVRHARRDANDEIKKSEKEKEIAEDESKRFQQDVQKITDQYIKKIDERMSVKEKEILTF